MTRDFTTTRQILADWLDRPHIHQFIIGVIIFNAILLGLETPPEVMGTAGTIILTLDWICLAIFVIKIALKLVARGARFFRSGWNVFDFLIVGIALMPAPTGCQFCAPCASCGYCGSSQQRHDCAAWSRGL